MCAAPAQDEAFGQYLQTGFILPCIFLAVLTLISALSLKTIRVIRMSTVHEKDRDDNERGGKRQKVAIDQDEWARFQEEVLDSVALLPQKTFTQNSSTTIEAEPVLHNNGEQTQQAITGIEEEEEEAGMETRAPKQKAEREAKEEILSRLDEEERAQEEADQRVQALKDRLQRIKEKRKAGKTKQAT